MADIKTMKQYGEGVCKPALTESYRITGSFDKKAYKKMLKSMGIHSSYGTYVIKALLETSDTPFQELKNVKNILEKSGVKIIFFEDPDTGLMEGDRVIDFNFNVTDEKGRPLKVKWQYGSILKPKGRTNSERAKTLKKMNDNLMKAIKELPIQRQRKIIQKIKEHFKDLIYQQKYFEDYYEDWFNFLAIKKIKFDIVKKTKISKRA